MAQVILNLEIDEILRAFTTGAKNEGFRLLIVAGQSRPKLTRQ